MSDKDEEAILKRRELFQHLSKKTSQLSFFIRNSYCAPQLVTLPVITLLSVYLTSFYESIGAKLSYISFFIALARSLDVIADPVMSYATDSFRSVHGRRRPFVFAGCWVYALTLILLLSPPTSLHSFGVSLWFGFSYVTFFLSNAFVAIPYDALGPELTDNYEDRSKLFFTAGMYDGIGSLIAVILPGFIAYVLKLSNSDCNSDSCYSASGIGHSCMPNSATGKKLAYHIFNASTTSWEVDGNTFSNPASLFQSNVCNQRSSADDSVLGTYCKCVAECGSLCSVDNTRTAYVVIGVGYGIWMVLSMSNLVYWIRERSQLVGNNLEPQPPIVPSILNTMRNKAFMALLPAWVCDAVAITTLSTMMTFYVQYVIMPEYQTEEHGGIDCNKGVHVVGQPSDTWKCKSSVVLGAIISCMLICAFLACPVWLVICQKFGKRVAWLTWSVAMAVCIVLFAAVGRGDVVLAVALGGVAGTTLGAKFLSDAILADIIDYDEFLSGQRNEATYTMFKSFLPKICAIPAAAVPIAILSAIGQVPSINGRVQEQPQRVRMFCVVITILVPAVLCFISFLIKLRFPLQTKDQVHMIDEGIGKHMLGQSAPDPLCGIEYSLDKYTPEEERVVNHLNYFPGLADAEALKLCLEADRPEIAVSDIIHRMRDWSALCFFFFVGLVVSVALTSRFLPHPTFSILPVLSIIGLGTSITAGGFCAMRLKAAVELLEKSNLPSLDLLDRIIDHRKKIQEIRQAKTVVVRQETKVNGYDELQVDGDDQTEDLKEENERRNVDRNTVSGWQDLIGSGAMIGKERSTSKIVETARLSKYTTPTGPRPLTVWEIELFAFVREQAAKNAAEACAHLGLQNPETDRTATSSPASIVSFANTDTDEEEKGETEAQASAKRDDRKGSDSESESDISAAEVRLRNSAGAGVATGAGAGAGAEAATGAGAGAGAGAATKVGTQSAAAVAAAATASSAKTSGFVALKSDSTQSPSKSAAIQNSRTSIVSLMLKDQVMFGGLYDDDDSDDDDVDMLHIFPSGNGPSNGAIGGAVGTSTGTGTSNGAGTGAGGAGAGAGGSIGAGAGAGGGHAGQAVERNAAAPAPELAVTQVHGFSWSDSLRSSPSSPIDANWPDSDNDI